MVYGPSLSASVTLEISLLLLILTLAGLLWYIINHCVNTNDAGTANFLA